MSGIYVRVGGRNIRLDRTTFEKWLPALIGVSYWHGHFDANVLVHQLQIRLHGHTSVPIRTTHVVNLLGDLFDALSGGQWGSKDSNVKEIVDDVLKDERSATDYRGLYRTRNRFLMLCVVAHCTQSDRLAAVIGSFIEDRARRIVEHEEPIRLPEWCLGLYELRGLMHDIEIQRLVDRLSDMGRGLISEWDLGPYYNDYPRRHHHRRPPLPLPWWEPLAVGPVRRHRSLDDLRVGFPIRSTWPSPAMTPAMLPEGGYFDDAEAIQMEQIVQAYHMQDLEKRVKHLEWQT
jgi:hypothetical protein